VPTGDLSGARAFQGHPLAGSPAGRLRDAAARIIAAGTLPRCPHPDQPALWYLPAGWLTCVPCTTGLLEAAGSQQAGCHLCGAPATAVAAWVVGDIPCIGPLCDQCHSTGLVPLTPN